MGTIIALRILYTVFNTHQMILPEVDIAFNDIIMTKFIVNIYGGNYNIPTQSVGS